jgi:hypothetical protein
MADLIPGLAGAGVLAVLGGMILVVVLLALAFYVYMALALQTIAKKTKTENAWLAWIPIANIYLMTQIGGLSGWWTLGILAVFVPFVGSMAVAALMIYLWWQICDARGKPGWWALLMLIPIVNVIMPGIIAWTK